MLLQLDNITKSYGKKIVLNQISYQFTPGLYGLLGANGWQNNLIKFDEPLYISR